MCGMNQQNQARCSYRLASFGAIGLGWIIWVLGKILGTPRPMRIGLSGLLLWAGMLGVSLADPSPNSGENANAQETAASGSAGAIKDPFNPQAYLLEMASKMKGTNVSRAVVGETGIVPSSTLYAKATPSTSTSSQVTWLSPEASATKKSTASKPTTSGVTWITSGQPVVGQPLAPRSETSLPFWSSVGKGATGTTSESPTTQVRWLTPAGTSAATPPAAAQPSPTPVTPQTSRRPAVAEPDVSAPSATSERSSSPAGLVSAEPVVATPLTPEPPINHARWLNAPRQATPQPAQPAPVTRPTTSEPVVNQTFTTPIAPSSVRHVRVLTPEPVRTTQPATAPTTSQAAEPATRSDYQVSRPIVAPKQTLNKDTWLAPENRAAQRALEKIQRRQEGITDAPAVTDTLQGMTYDSRGRLTPQSFHQREVESDSQMLLLSGGVVNPQMALMAANPAAYAATDLSQAKHFYEREKTPWTLGADLEKYREHALREGSREFGGSLVKALERVGLAVEDTTNVITLGYASERGQIFRTNDGKGLFEAPDRLPNQVGETIGSFGDGLYSVFDLVTLNALPDPEKYVYQDNHPIVRPLVFTGRTIGGVWKTTEEIGNAVTWGYFDNVTGSIGMVIEDLIEMLKHTGQAVTNIARLPVHALGGKDGEADKALDWVLLVPLEFASNVVEMKGISNMGDYETAFADKGVIGSILEFGGSTFIVYRAVDEMIDELKDDSHHDHRKSDAGDTVDDVIDDVVDDPPEDTGSMWTDFVFTDDGIYSGTRPAD